MCLDHNNQSLKTSSRHSISTVIQHPPWRSFCCNMHTAPKAAMLLLALAALCLGASAQCQGTAAPGGSCGSQNSLCCPGSQCCSNFGKWTLLLSQALAVTNLQLFPVEITTQYAAVAAMQSIYPLRPPAAFRCLAAARHCGIRFPPHAGYCGVTLSDHCGAGCQVGFGRCSGSSPVATTTDPAPQPTPQQPSSGGVGALLSAQQWEALFPNRNNPQCECGGTTAQLLVELVPYTLLHPQSPNADGMWCWQISSTPAASSQSEECTG